MNLRLLFHFFLLLSALSYALAQSADPSRKAVLTGQVLNAATGEPVKKSHMVLSKADAGDTNQGSTPSLMVNTDAEGRFTFDAVEPGSYRLAVQRNGFVPTEYGALGADRPGTVFVLASEQKLDLTIKVVPLGVIAGRVLDADGDAVPGAVVSAIRSFFMNGKRTIERLNRVKTNDLGEYRLYDLPPGRYYLAAAITNFLPADSPPSDEDSGLIYYQNATDLGSATPLDLTAGSTLNSIDLFSARVRRTTINGTILNPPAGNSVMVYLMPRDSSLPLKFIRQDAEYHAETGKFEIHGVAPGAYVLVANSSGTSRRFFARQPLAVTGAETQDVALALSPALDLHGHVRVEGQGVLNLSTLEVALQSREEGPAGSSQTGPDGSFTLANIVPDTYVLSVTGLPATCYLKSVRVGEQEFPPSDVDLTHGPSGIISIVVSAAAGQVYGVVMNDKQQPAAGALVALIPSQRQRGDLYKTATTNPAGGFSLQGIAPGDYKLFAWQGIDTGAYQDPDFLKRFENQGEPVNLVENGNRSVQLKIIPHETTY